MHKMFCSNLLHQVYPVVDGGPVEKRYVFFVWLPNVKARLHQLSAALEDAVPAAQAGARSDTSWVSIDYRIAQFDICFMETRQFDIKKKKPSFFNKMFWRWDEVVCLAVSKLVYFTKMEWKHFLCITRVTWSTTGSYYWRKLQRKRQQEVVAGS